MKEILFWTWTLVLLFIFSPVLVAVGMIHIGRKVEAAGDELLRVEEEMIKKELYEKNV